MDTSPYHTKLLTTQRNGTRSAAANMLASSYPNTPCEDGHVLHLRALTPDSAFGSSKKTLHPFRQPDGPIAFPSVQNGRGLIFQSDHSAIAVRLVDKGWQVFPAPIALATQLFHQDDVHTPTNRRKMGVRAKGPLRMAIVDGCDADLSQPYEEAFFAAIDGLFQSPMADTPLGDVRTLAPYATTLPDHLLFRSWCNWPTPSTHDTQCLITVLDTLAQFILNRERHLWPEIPTSLTFTARLEHTKGTTLGNVPLSLTPHYSPSFSTRTPAHDAMRNAFKQRLDVYRKAIKPWVNGQGWGVPTTHRHPRDPIMLSTYGHRHTPTAHQQLLIHAQVQAMVEGIAWPDLTSHHPSP